MFCSPTVAGRGFLLFGRLFVVQAGSEVGDVDRPVFSSGLFISSYLKGGRPQDLCDNAFFPGGRELFVGGVVKVDPDPDLVSGEELCGLWLESFVEVIGRLVPGGDVVVPSRLSYDLPGGLQSCEEVVLRGSLVRHLLRQVLAVCPD